MNGIELAIRFSTVTNALRYCGPGTAQAAFARYLEKQDNEPEVREAFKKFEGLYPYLERIGAATKKDWLSHEVVEAYWIGNENTEKAAHELPRIIQMLMDRGLPRSIGERLIKELPRKALPHHTFHVIYTGVGQTTGTVATTLENMDTCRPSLSRVAEVKENELLVERKPLLKNDKGYYLGPTQKSKAQYDKKFIPSIHAGGWMIMHWGHACLIPTEEQRKQLEEFTKQTLNTINAPFPGTS